MPWEDYLGTQLPAGSLLPPNFKTFNFFDETTGIAISAKTLDTTTAAKLANPEHGTIGDRPRLFLPFR
ncbi:MULTISPECIES: hypothetical protein [Pseudomonas]|uniref:endonuclease toxin domain-containing protein n=1 Tax=Pseudomonas TaxID=286 RepID=UPI0009E31540